MSDSGDCSDAEMNQPSCSKRDAQNNEREKRNRRIIMRIEFQDSGDSDGDTASSISTNDNDTTAAASTAVSIDLDTRPSCSSKRSTVKQLPKAVKSPNSDLALRKSARHLRRRRAANRLHSDTDPSSSGSEIDERITRLRDRGTKRKKINHSEDEQDAINENTQKSIDDGSCSDNSSSSSNELLEKCPICLFTFRQQEVGTPAACEHSFCAACIEAWAKNVQTCPIDRLAFDKIIVLDNFEHRKVVREVRLDSSNSKKELHLEDENDVAGAASADEDITNCEICHSPDREDIMLLCDSCNQGYHMDCLDPPLFEIPEDSWYCDNCIDSNDEAEDESLELAEDLATLYEDIRGMGLPETRLRVRQVQQPRILRTRQNERIRAAVLRRTRTSSGAQMETTTLTETTTQRNRSRTTTRTSTTTRTTTTTTRRRRKPRRRQAKRRTYVVEYDLNNFDEKFALKTSKKVIKRRRRRKLTRRTATRSLADGVRLTASKRLAEQLGVKPDAAYSSHIGGGSASSFTLFGNVNDLEYFSDGDDVRDDMGGHMDNGHAASTAVQSSVRYASIGAPRIRRALLQGKARTAGSTHHPAPLPSATGDILSSIMDMQDRWHSATRNFNDVHINSADGSLKLPQSDKKSDKPNTNLPQNTKHITKMPLYQPGGAGPNFGRGGNNRYSAGNSNNNNSYHAGGGAGGGSGAGTGHQYQRHSTGGSDNQTFNSGNNNNMPNTNFTPFNIRFNSPRQQQQQRQQDQQKRNQQSHQSQYPSGSFAHIIPQQPQRPLFGGLPAPINTPRLTIPHVLTVPPPPMPPSWNSSLFKMNTDFGNKNNAENDDDDDNCPNFSIYSQESQAVATELFAEPNKESKEAEKDDDEMNEDLVQLDDDEDIPLPPEAEGDNAAKVNDEQNVGSELYEPENPTDEQDDEEKVKAIVEPDPTVKKKGRGKNTAEPKDDNSPASTTTPAHKVPDDEDELKPRSTPSPSQLKEDRNVDRGKGVLELYDDSDWEELDIDKPKEFEKAVVDNGGGKTPPDSSSNKKESKKSRETAKSSGGDSAPERSYTPCLDEKSAEEDATAQHDKSESHAAGDENAVEPKKHAPVIDTEQISEDEELEKESAPKRRSRSRQRNEDNAAVGKSKRSSKRSKDNSETFKKVGKRRKDRNYRGDKDKKDRSRSRVSNSKLLRTTTRSRSPKLSPSRSRSRNRGRSRNRSRSANLKNSLSRSRSLNRSPRARRRNSRSKSYSRSKSNSHSPYGSRNRSSYRGREFGRGFVRGRATGGLRFNYRQQQFPNRPYQQPQQQQPYNQQYHHQQHQNQNHYSTHLARPKRRELPRYDVRNVVSRHQHRDRYGRDADRSARSRSISFEPRRSFSRSSSGSRMASVPPKRFRSFSMSPSPTGAGAGMRRRSMSPGNRRYQRSPTPLAGGVHRGSPLHPQERSNSTVSLRSRSQTPARMNGGRVMSASKHSPGFSPRYTPRISRSRSKSPRKKKKKKTDKKKRTKKRATSNSPVRRHRRLSRQRDPFDEDDFLAPQLGKKTKKSLGGIGTSHWSPSPSPSFSNDHTNYLHDSGPGLVGGDKPCSWTPPLGTPHAPGAHYGEESPPRLSLTPLGVKKLKAKRDKGKKKKKLLEKQRKEKRRKRHTMTPEPLPSKEIFASGNNILVSVSFNKEANTNTMSGGTTQQQTVVTLPATREGFMGGRRNSIDRLSSSISVGKKSKRKRKKLDAKPVAIIDLERSPFQVHQEPADVIVLTDSEDTNEDQVILRRERRRGSVASATNHDLLRESGQREKTPTVDCLNVIMETSYENMTQTTGPKTPPEPHLVKFNLPAKKLHKVRNNPLHDDTDDIHSADEMETVCSMRNSSVDNEPQQPHASDGLLSTQKIGPNTPPESGPCSPDAYDPFEPTKSPSLSPRSPTPTPAQNLEPMSSLQSSAGSVDKIDTLVGSQKHISHSDELPDVSTSTPTKSAASTATPQTNSNVINPVDLVMALMNKPNSSSSKQQELTSKSCDVTSTQYMNSATISTAMTVSGSEDKPADGNTITVLSNVILSSSSVVSSSQHIPVISSPPSLTRKLPLPKPGGSVASSSSGMAASSSNLRNGNTGGGGSSAAVAAASAGPSSSALDDSFNDIESPYSPGSADYEDLFEPPPESGNAIGSIRRMKGQPASGKAEMFDNLFGSTSPVGLHRISSRFNSATGRKNPRANNKNERKSKNKGNKIPDGQLYEDLPNSAVDLQNKDRFLRKLNRQERVVEEVKLVLKPHFNKKVITKDDYKDIMRRAVPKICHSRSGEINPHKIKNLIDAYVKRFRAKHKKLSLLNTGQVSSAVKCAAYLKKL